MSRNFWVIPRGTVKTICDLFLTGQPETGVRPFRLIKTGDLPRSSQSLFAKALYVFNYLKTKAVQMNKIRSEQELREIQMIRWDNVFKDVFSVTINDVNAARVQPVANPGEIKYSTFYDMLASLRNIN
jgi:hypothetical protein